MLFFKLNKDITVKSKRKIYQTNNNLKKSWYMYINIVHNRPFSKKE